MIRVRMGSLHDPGSEAILLPVSSDLTTITAAGRDVEVRIGEAVLQRLQGLGSLPVGGAVVTPGGDLPAAFLVHVVVQSADEPVSETGIRRALLNGLRRASEWEIESLALPPLGTGAGNLDPESSARVMVPLIVEHLESSEHPHEVTIMVPNEYEEEVFERELERSRAGAPAEEDSVPEARG